MRCLVAIKVSALNSREAILLTECLTYDAVICQAIFAALIQSRCVFLSIDLLIHLMTLLQFSLLGMRFKDVDDDIATN